MEILVILHNEVEDAGAIETWAKARGYRLRAIRPYLGEALGGLSEIDMLFIMGGAQCANDTLQHTYLQEEIDFIARAYSENIPLFGICLGAQLIAKALGGSVEKSPEKEIGFFPVTLSRDGLRDALFADFPNEFDVMHWHFDWVCQPPEGSTVLASSKGCPIQAYRVGRNVLGLQFHIEMHYERALKLAEKLPHHFDNSRFVLPASEFKKEQFENLHADVTHPLLDRFVALAKPLVSAS